MYVCDICSFYQAPYIYDDNYYQDEYTDYAGFEQYYSSNVKMKEKIVRLHDYCKNVFLDESLSYLEVGCGIGGTLNIANNVFEYVVGVEPSSLGYIAEKNGLVIIHDFFDDSLEIAEAYNAIGTFQVFEHLTNPLEVLMSIRKALKPNGIVLLNIPNGRTIIDNNLYHQVICEHINYYSAESIYMLAKQTGFKVLEIQNDISNMEYDVYLQREEHNYVDINNKKENDKLEIQSIINKYENVTIWGAGGKANIFSEFMQNDRKIKHLVDGDDSKEGLFISGINIAIERVDQSIIDSSNLIIIFASSYTDEIINRLTSEFDYHGDIVRFDKSRILVQSL